MANPTRSDQSIAHSEPVTVSTWKWIFRIVRWSTYLGAFVTLILIFHKTLPPAVQTSPQAAARVEEKFQEVEKSLADLNKT